MASRWLHVGKGLLVLLKKAVIYMASRWRSQNQQPLTAYMYTYMHGFTLAKPCTEIICEPTSRWLHVGKGLLVLLKKAVISNGFRGEFHSSGRVDTHKDAASYKKDLYNM